MTYQQKNKKVSDVISRQHSRNSTIMSALLNFLVKRYRGRFLIEGISSGAPPFSEIDLFNIAECFLFVISQR